MKNRIKKFALLLLLWTADNTYYLNNQAFVKDGVTLTIEAK